MQQQESHDQEQYEEQDLDAVNMQQQHQEQQMMENDINGLQQQDDAQYGDEMIEGQPMQISNALAEQRATKKRAQDDVKLLANRIALLKLEEKKVSRRCVSLWYDQVGFVARQAWKKIEETKKKAIDIMQVRQRNKERENEKDVFRQQKMQEEEALKERNNAIRDNQRQAIEINQKS